MTQTKQGTGNTTAVNILRAWLQAVGVTGTVSKTPGFDLSVPRPSGGSVEVMVKIGDEDMPGDGIRVLAKDLTGRKEEPALEAFYKILDAAGYDRRAPYDRGEDSRELNEKGNPRKLCYKDEDFLVAIRHSEFRRSPNPAKDRWERYRRIMEWQVGKFFGRNADLCVRWGMDLEDVMQYARCYLVNFCARYEDHNSKHEKAAEHRFIEYLYQRLNIDLRETLLKKERSTTPDGETVRIAMFGQHDRDMEVSPNPSEMYELVLDHPEEMEQARAIFEGRATGDLPDIFYEDSNADEGYVARNCELDTSSVAKRRESATNVLEKLLSEMPHDRLIEKLEEVSESFDHDVSARKEAKKRLAAHEASCKICRGIEDQPALAPEPKPAVSGRLPQASKLPVVRELVRQINDGKVSTRDLADVMNLQHRQVAYYRDAALQLGLIQEDSAVTESGLALLTTREGGSKEAQIFRDGIQSSPTLQCLAWYFQDESKTVGDLLDFVMEHFDYKQSTAETRVQRFNHWRKFLGATKTSG